MNKSDFYKKYFTRDSEPGEEFNEFGYPTTVETASGPITTEDQWQEFLETQIDLPQFFKMSPDACEVAGIEYTELYYEQRIDLEEGYPNVQEQLDGIYKCLLKIKESGIDLGTDGQDYLDSITKVKNKFPKEE